MAGGWLRRVLKCIDTFNNTWYIYWVWDSLFVFFISTHIHDIWLFSHTTCLKICPHRPTFILNHYAILSNISTYKYIQQNTFTIQLQNIITILFYIIILISSKQTNHRSIYRSILHIPPPSPFPSHFNYPLINIYIYRIYTYNTTFNHHL